MYIKNREKIPIQSINIQDDHFLFTYPVCIDNIVTSIKRVGLVHPVILTPSSKPESFKIICGLKRVLAVKQLGNTFIDAEVIKNTDSDHLLFLMSIHETLSHRKINYIEEGTILKKLTTTFGFSRESAIKRFMPQLGLNPSGYLFDRIVSVASLEENIKELLISKELPIHVAEYFLHFKPDERIRLAKLINNLGYGTNKIKEFLTIVREIALKNDATPLDVFEDEQIKAVLGSDITDHQKGISIREQLKKKKFPFISMLEEKSSDLIKSINLSSEIKFCLSDFFEEKKIKLEITLKRADELSLIIKKLCSLEERNELEKLFNLMD